MVCVANYNIEDNHATLAMEHEEREEKQEKPIL